MKRTTQYSYEKNIPAFGMVGRDSVLTLSHTKEAVVMWCDGQDPRVCGYDQFSFHRHPTVEMKATVGKTTPSSSLTQLPHPITGPALLPCVPLCPSSHPITHVICTEYSAYFKSYLFMCVWACVCMHVWCHVWVPVEAGRSLRASGAGVTGRLRHQTWSSRIEISIFIKKMPL